MRQHIVAFLAALGVWAVANLGVTSWVVPASAQSTAGASTGALDWSCNRAARLVREVERTCQPSGSACTGYCIADFTTFGYCGLPWQSRYQCQERQQVPRPIWRARADCSWGSYGCSCGTDWQYIQDAGTSLETWCDIP